MLLTSKQIDTTLNEVDVTRQEPMYQLVDPQLMRQIMQRTGTGAPTTVRELAATVGVPHGTIGNLLTGEQSSVPYDKAAAITAAIGVDLLVLFKPTGRIAATQAEAVPA